MPTLYRKFVRDDVAAAHKLSLEVGWPHRVEDWRFVQRLGAGHVALDGGSVVGKRLMRLALRDLTGRAVMLNATRAGQPLYEKLGFNAIDTVEQHQGLAA